MSNQSLDPRVNRLDLEGNEGTQQEHESWQTYEVFHQAKRGKQHVHVGSLHAPDKDLAMVFAKEQYGRRNKCVNLWVVKTADIFALNIEDEDMFATTPEKQHREAIIYKVRDRIQAFKEKQST